VRNSCVLQEDLFAAMQIMIKTLTGRKVLWLVCLLTETDSVFSGCLVLLRVPLFGSNLLTSSPQIRYAVRMFTPYCRCNSCSRVSVQILMVKQALQEKEGIQVDQIRLIYSGKQL
jgi:hypothetical protein